METTANMVRSRAAERQRLCAGVKVLIVERLDLDIDPELITNDQPLFGRGLELDSVDSLEISVGLYEKFDVHLTDDNVEALLSVNRMVDFVEENLA